MSAGAHALCEGMLVLICSKCNFTCTFLIFRVEIFLTMLRFRIREGRGGAMMQKSEEF